LLARGERVRVVVRSADQGKAWADRGAEVAVADLGDRAAVARALGGVDGAYLLVPPVFAAADPIAAGTAVATALADAAAEAGIRHVVLLSSVGAEHPTGTGPIRILHAAEGLLRARGVPTTALRASYFLENWGSVSAVAKSDGVLPMFVAANRPLPQVATRDIGEAAATLLVEGPPAGGFRTVGLAGPTDWTPTEIAAELGRLFGRTVTPAESPLSAAIPALTAAGLPPAWAALYAELYAGVADGKVAFPNGPDRRGTTTASGVFG
ncbi:MAG: NmrA family NAD(P)-binding protein, partial [Myxococcota bacterium]